MRISKVCPECGASGQLEILYGLPTRDAVAAAERGELVLGGCVVFEDAPAWQCPKCGHTHGSRHLRD